MRKVKAGMRFKRHGVRGAGNVFKIVSVSHKSGYATTSKGTKVRIARLVTSKNYKAI